MKTEHISKGIQWSLELMAVAYVAVMAVFLINADWPLIVANKISLSYGWPLVIFPTEKFWFSLAASVPGTRAFLAFSAAQKPAQARLCVKVLQISLVLAGIFFAWQFIFHTHAPLYVIAFLTEAVQVVFYLFLIRRLP
jgi:hypothetical protein